MNKNSLEIKEEIHNNLHLNALTAKSLPSIAISTVLGFSSTPAISDAVRFSLSLY